MPASSNPDRYFLKLTLLFAAVTGTMAVAYESGLAVPGRVMELCSPVITACTGAISSFTFEFKMVVGLFFISFGFAAWKKARAAWLFKAAKREIVNDPGLKERIDQITSRDSSQLPEVVLIAGNGTAWLSGAGKPVVYLAAEFAALLDDEELKALIFHEVAHYRRRDHLKLILASFIKDALFFIPIASVLYKRYSAEKEFAADTLAAPGEAEKVALASAIMKALKTGLSVSLPATTGFSDDIPGQRIERLMGKGSDPGPGAEKKPKTAVAATIIIALIITGTVARNGIYRIACNHGADCSAPGTDCCLIK